MNSSYLELAKIQVRNEKGWVERKGRFDYISWARAWHELQKRFPGSTRTVYEDPHAGLNYFTDNATAYVKVGVSVPQKDGAMLEHIDYMPITNNSNKSIPVAEITSFEVNVAIQRATAKAIAMQGLGLSLWFGEDTELMSEPGSNGQGAANVEAKKPTLTSKVKGFDKVQDYIRSNAALGAEQLALNLSQRFTIVAASKKLIADIVTDEHKAKA